MSKKFEPKDQVAYIPNHADGIGHKDTEFGFVTSVKGDTVYCRYWNRATFPVTLRTKHNSEGCQAENLIKHQSQPEHVVDEAWNRYVEK